ncbi:MAG: type II secretion system GspH family protein [Alphaproteobacteria bacterium]|nr:type II secretion system GspH family protein [Alphaproteobacteria bacterium]
MHQSTLRNLQSGFSLAEAAMVLAVMAVVIGALVPSFLSIRVAEQVRATSQNLKTVMNTIAGFVQSSGCVPCPVPAERAYDISAHGNVAGGDGIKLCGGCTRAVGLLPFRSLGLPESLAKDAYGHWLTYAVDITLAGYIPTLPNIQPVADKGLCSVTFASANPVHVTLSNSSPQNNIAVLLLSHGANGYGAYKNQPGSSNDRLPFPSASPACSGLTGAERCNSTLTPSYVMATPAQGSDPFDDVYFYLDRNALVTYLSNPACATGWP